MNEANTSAPESERNADAGAHSGSKPEHASSPADQAEVREGEVRGERGALDLDGVTAPREGSVEVHSPATAATAAASAAPSVDVENRHAPDSPTTTLITTLRAQVTELSDQSQALNAKLIQAISKHADLEDAHVHLQQEHQDLEGHAKELKVEKAKWEESMNTGLLVERSQIKDEMQRLAAGLVEEERRRGSAEERRQQVENDVDDLAASLFDQANTMVAAERMARTEAESRLKRTEENLAAAEAAVRDMQVHLQSLPAPGSASPKDVVQAQRRFLASHLPHTEYLAFLQHLRSLRPLKETSKALFPPPGITTLIAQAFIARTISEDHDPTIRLDAAPDLSYFSRRNVGPAIIAGELIIEPVSANSLLPTLTVPLHEVGCSLCGKPVFPNAVPQSPAASHFGPPPTHPTKPSRFSLKPFFNTTSPSANASPTQSPLASPAPTTTFSSVYIFRVNKPAATSATSGEKEAKAYPLCKSGWCLERLRAAGELWHFVRTGIIHPVWHGEDGHTLLGEEVRNTPQDRRVSSSSATTSSTAIEKPPLPERKKSGGWGLGFKRGATAGDRGSVASASGSGWFGRSGSATPPQVSPSLPDVDEKKRLEAVPDEVHLPSESPKLDQAEPRGLDAPIELSPTADNAEKRSSIDVPRIEEHEASPAAPLRAEAAATAGDEDGFRPKRSDSSASLTTSHTGTEEGTFSTPKGQDASLPEDEQKEEETSQSPAKDSLAPLNTDVAPAVDLNSPLAESAPSSDSPVPPPIPRRAAERGHGASKSVSAAPSRVDTPVEPESGEIPEAIDPTAVDEAREATPVPAQAERKGPPPPLPPRNPVTPVAQVAGSDYVPEGEKRWMKLHDKKEDETWEEKTWKTVVKLKENMWRARIGVNDEMDD